MGNVFKVISVLEEADFLSPPITLFTQGSSSYKSSQSGFLSLVALALIALFSACEIKDIYLKEKVRLQNPRHLHILRQIQV